MTSVKKKSKPVKAVKQQGNSSRIDYPFSAIVGQEKLKQALICAAIDPTLGGVLIFGDRGTGKSTIIRSLAALLPKISVKSDCLYNCEPGISYSFCTKCSDSEQCQLIKSEQIPIPVVDLPLGATEDRIVGSLDLEHALAYGEKIFEPGLLAKANRGFLYIDEVNLLEDHLVDLLLDVAASGENVVEREGLSIRHAARFVLIGSGNPEEGELRPQLLDRFGLSVEVKTPTDIQQRIEVVKRRDAFEQDPKAFLESWKNKNATLRRKIKKAQDILEQTQINDKTLETISRICIQIGSDGLRGELTLMRAARSLAAFQGDKNVTDKHIMEMAGPALGHRLRRDPLDDVGSTVRIDRALEEVLTS